MVREYYFAKPRFEHVITDASLVANKPLSWGWVPNSVFEFACAFSTTFAAGFFNFSGYRRLPFYKGVWKYFAAYYGALMVSRWADRAIIRENKYDDKVIDEYIRLHPERFPVYEPKTLKETFEGWIPIRSGGSTLMSDLKAWGRKKDTDHYVPLNDEGSA